MNILVGLSGGVDSSVVAALLVEQGHSVAGITMEIYGGDSSTPVTGTNACYGPDEVEDVESAAQICQQLGIRHHVVDLKQEYSTVILDYFKTEYRLGRTPNPCVRCNSRMKFGLMLERARQSGIIFDKFATGHYARVSQDEASGLYELKRAADQKKDQTYFLCKLTQSQLTEVLFPLAGFTKNEVRTHARRLGLLTHDKPDSQDFAAGDYQSIIGDAGAPGPLMHENGTALGTHQGITRYTIGQRKGLGIAAGTPLYVTRIDAKNNMVYVSNDEQGLLHSVVVADDMHWISTITAQSGTPVQARIRHSQIPAEATIESATGNNLQIRFAQPQRAITPGQILALYSGDTVLGGATIVEARD